MAKLLLTPLRFIAPVNFSLKNYGSELLNLTKTVGKVELISTFTTAVCESWNVGIVLEIIRNSSRTRQLKPGLHIVVTIAEYAPDVAPKRMLRLSIQRLQIFLVKYEYLQSLQVCEDQGIREKLKNVFATMCLRSLQLIKIYGDQA